MESIDDQEEKVWGIVLEAGVLQGWKFEETEAVATKVANKYDTVHMLATLQPRHWVKMALKEEFGECVMKCLRRATAKRPDYPAQFASSPKRKINRAGIYKGDELVKM